MKSDDIYLGIDVGGTNVKMAMVRPGGEIVARRSAAVGPGKSSRDVVALIRREAGELVGDGRPAAAGIGLPGIVDADAGVVHASPNFPSWDDEPMREMIGEALGLPAAIDNDANLYALGEAMCGAGRGRRNVIVLTLGTGIGGGLIFDGEVFHGDGGFAGEVGHIVVEPEGVPCGCGGRGCWEQYAASRAFGVHAGRLPAGEREGLLAAAGVGIEGLTPEIVARLAADGDAAATKLWDEFGRYLGIGIATLVNVLGVMSFVVGGGIAQSWERFIDSARRSAQSHTYPRYAKQMEFLRSELGGDAGVIGAALVAERRAG